MQVRLAITEREVDTAWASTPTGLGVWLCVSVSLCLCVCVSLCLCGSVALWLCGPVAWRRAV